MTQINDVGDIRTKAQLNPEDRAAINRSIVMTLVGVAAVTAAVFLGSAEKAAPNATGASASPPAVEVSPAASMQPTEAVGGSSYFPHLMTPDEVSSLAPSRADAR